MPVPSPHTQIFLLPSAELLTQHPAPQRGPEGNRKDQEEGGDRPSIKDHPNWQTAGPCQQEEEKVKRGAFELLQITFLPDRIRLSFLSRSPSFYKSEHRMGKSSWECFTHLPGKFFKLSS